MDSDPILLGEGPGSGGEVGMEGRAGLWGPYCRYRKEALAAQPHPRDLREGDRGQAGETDTQTHRETQVVAPAVTTDRSTSVPGKTNFVAGSEEGPDFTRRHSH